MDTVRKTHRRILLLGSLACALVAIPFWWTRPWADSVFRVTVSVSTGDLTPAIERSRQILFRDTASACPTIEMDLDLGAFADQFARLEVQGEVRERGGETKLARHTACQAQVIGRPGAFPLTLAGWPGGDATRMHQQSLGAWGTVPISLGKRLLYYAEEGTLSHVLRVPAEARLHLSILSPRATDSRLQTRSVEMPVRTTSPDTPVEGGSSDRPPDVFIYLIDALRADHLGCYGYHRATSLNIDAFAADATVFEQAQSAAPATKPSVATLLTGLYPCAHGAVRNLDMLEEWPVLLSEVLEERGYVTWAVVTNNNASASFGFDQGYHGFLFQRGHLLRTGENAPWVYNHVARILGGMDTEQPVFMYLHTIEPHSPYRPEPTSFAKLDRGLDGSCDGSVEALRAAGRRHPDLSGEDLDHLVDLYDAEICDADLGFQGFLEVIEAAGRLENAMVVLLADHGESFCEHDTMQHGNHLNQEEIHVPLVVRFPRGRFAGVRVGQPVSLIDLFPTVLRQTGSRPRLPYPLPGRDLTLCAARPGEPFRRSIFAENSRVDSLDMVGVIDEEGYKRTVDLAVTPESLATKRSIGFWDTRADPTEMADLSGAQPMRAAYADQVIAQWLLSQRDWRAARGAARPPSVGMTDDLRRDLRALGYLD
jgi:arylsulfatase